MTAFMNQPQSRILPLVICISAFFGAFFSDQAFAVSRSSAKGSAPSKIQVVQALKSWRERVIALSQKAAKSQQSQFKVLAALHLKSIPNKYSADSSNAVGSTSREALLKQVSEPLEQIEAADRDRSELDSQAKIIDQLIFSVDTKWGGSNLAGFLEIELLDLAVNDVTEPGTGVWWKFLVQASIALREVMEPGEDPIRFLEGYMRESTVLDPKSVVDIQEARRYIGD